MGSKTNRKYHRTKARSSASKQSIGLKQVAMKRHPRLSKDRSEHVRDDLNRDVGLLYNALENPLAAPSSTSQAESVDSIAESLQGLGR